MDRGPAAAFVLVLEENIDRYGTVRGPEQREGPSEITKWQDFSVGAAGIELASGEPESSRNVAKTCELGSANSPGATVDDDSHGSGAVPTDIDGAIRVAAKLAIDAGDLDRARSQLDLLEAKPAPSTASVMLLTSA